MVEKMIGWLKTSEAAKYAVISPRTLRTWLKQGLRHSRLPTGTVLIRVAWIDEFLASYEVKPGKEKEQLDAMVDDIVGGLLK